MHQILLRGTKQGQFPYTHTLDTCKLCLNNGKMIKLILSIHLKLLGQLIIYHGIR